MSRTFGGRSRPLDGATLPDAGDRVPLCGLARPRDAGEADYLTRGRRLVSRWGDCLYHAGETAYLTRERWLISCWGDGLFHAGETAYFMLGRRLV